MVMTLSAYVCSRLGQDLFPNRCIRLVGTSNSHIRPARRNCDSNGPESEYSVRMLRISHGRQVS